MPPIQSGDFVAPVDAVQNLPEILGARGRHATLWCGP